MVIDTGTEVGARVDARLRDELVAWLVTVAPDGTPVPTPVWFLWDGTTILPYSQPDRPKPRHIARNPRGAGAADRCPGHALAVITGDAAVDASALNAAELPGYVTKYGAQIARQGFSNRPRSRRSIPCRSASR